MKNSFFKESKELSIAFPDTHPHLFRTYSSIKEMVAKGYKVGNTPGGDIDEDFKLDLHRSELYLFKDCVGLVSVENIENISKETISLILQEMNNNSDLVLTRTAINRYNYTLYEPCCLSDDICKNILSELYEVDPGDLSTSMHSCTEVTSREDSWVHSVIQYALNNSLLIPLNLYSKDVDLQLGLDILLDGGINFNEDIRYGCNSYSEINIRFGLKLTGSKFKISAWVES